MDLVNLHIYPSAFKFETRILKETKSIIKLGLASHIIILSTHEKGQLTKESITDKITVFRLKSLASLLPENKATRGLLYFEFYIRVLIFALSRKIHLINSHSLMVLPVSVIIKKIKRIKLIYDPHELETERVGLKGLAQKISKWVERKLIYSSEVVIVVGGSIQRWYESTYGLSNVYLIKNTPYYTEAIESDVLRKKFDIPENQLVFIHQGVLMNGRNIELYLNVFSGLPSSMHLVIMGYGPQEGLVKDFASRFQNIHFLPAVRPNEILYYTSSADIGLHVPENACLSYYYSLPNKFFEYIMAEIPLIVCDFPDMSSIVNNYQLGWSVPVSEDEVSKLIKSLTMEGMKQKKENIRKVKKLFSWEKEETTLIEIFKKVK